MQVQNGSRVFFELLFFERIGEDREECSVTSGRCLDDKGNIFFFCLIIKIGLVFSGPFLMPVEIKVRAIVNAFQLFPAKWEFILYIKCSGRIMGELALADFPQAAAHAPAINQHAEPLVLAPSTAPTMVSGNEIPIAPLPAAGTLAMLTSAGEVRPLEELENEVIRFAISHYRGQMSEVARRLKIGRSTLYRKLDEAADNEPGNANEAS